MNDKLIKIDTLLRLERNRIKINISEFSDKKSDYFDVFLKIKRLNNYLIKNHLSYITDVFFIKNKNGGKSISFTFYTFFDFGWTHEIYNLNSTDKKIKLGGWYSSYSVHENMKKSYCSLCEISTEIPDYINLIGNDIKKYFDKYLMNKFNYSSIKKKEN